MKKYFPILLIVSIASVLRLAYLDKIPNAISGDELLYALTAKSVYLTGHDVSGTWNPLSAFIFRYPPHEKQAELPYFLHVLTAPLPFSLFLAKLPFAILSIGIVILLSLIATALFGEPIGIATGLVAAVNPWLVVMGRTGYESTPATFFYLLGLYLMLTKRAWSILWSMFPFVLAFYSYIGTKLIFAPFIGVAALVSYLQRKQYKKQYVLVCLAAIACTVGYLVLLKTSPTGSRISELFLPNSLSVSSDVNDMRRTSIQLSFISLAVNKYTVYVQEVLAKVFRIFSPTYLFLEGDQFFLPARQSFFYYIDFLFMALGSLVIFTKKRIYFFLVWVFIILGTFPHLFHDSNGDFSGWMVVYWQETLVLEHSVLWLPLALYASNRLWERDDDEVGFFLLLFALVCSVFAGFLQMSIYVYAVVILWNIFSFFMRHDRRNSIRSSRIIILALVCSVMIESIQLIPSFQAFVLSPRGTIDGNFIFKNYLLPFQNIITLLAPDYWGSPATYNYFGGGAFYFEKMIFIGIVPLLFALYGMIKAKQKTIIFWTVLGLVTLSMGFSLPTSWIPYYLHIPILSTSYPTRIFLVYAFSFSILSCYGLDAFLRKPDGKRMMYILGGASIVLALAWAVVVSAWCIRSGALHCFGLTSATWRWVRTILFTNKDEVSYVAVSLRNLIVPTAFMLSGWGLVLVSKFSKKLVFIFVCVLTITSGLYFAQKYVYFGEKRFIYPSLPVITTLGKLAGHNRVWGYGNAFMEKNFSEYFQWFSTDGYSNLSPRRYAELLSTIINGGKLGGSIRRSDTDLYAMSERDGMDANPFRLRMMSLLGVKYIVESKIGDLKDTRTVQERFPSTLFTLVWQDNTWRIWQYAHVLPRAMFLTKAIVSADGQKIVDMLYDTSFDLSKTVILESEPKDSVRLPDAATGSAVITSYTLNTISVQAKSSSGGYVLLTDNYYPGWTATVDGKAATIMRADYSFRAVFVPKGSHTVVFEYRPGTVIAGAIIACFGVLLSSAVIAYHKVRRKQGKRGGTNDNPGPK